MGITERVPKWLWKIELVYAIVSLVVGYIYFGL